MGIESVFAVLKRGIIGVFQPGPVEEMTNGGEIGTGAYHRE